MAGLLQQAQQENEPAQQEAMEQEQPVSGGNDEQEIGKRKEKSSKISQLMALHVYENSDSIIKTLQSAPDLVMGVGQLIGQLLLFAGIQAKEAKTTLEPQVLFKSAVDVTRIIGELLINKGIITADQEVPMMSKAFKMGGDTFVTTASLSPEERKQYADIYHKFVAMTQQQPQQPEPQGGQQDGIPTR